MSLARSAAITVAFLGSASCGAVVAANYLTEKKAKLAESKNRLSRALSLEAKDAALLAAQAQETHPIAPGDMSLAFNESQMLKQRQSGVYYGAFTGEYRP
mmetsp:Transcript_11617/g.22956  ORF Transcript_11617/g.22956 Transcript_11617/m.22956 type:complete len:100 (+) Transcript_11617:93-392(+)|eukprot:CAMPEP_0173412446 /NCGR_PEP_ID=MMETSP1356-20130122/79498_1 /TAXON_ID=77927 ORGANISM="Hemiselmis virescens, Strain PCC157" /NCGR_SAMPLE_ID=MMETSP1356 /ASSEMBLY_ACC=CAM_ASM_000847 /LENGTH=99 /DNA_ID=CAMNT_0014374343 /DNA_START=97 /DNA_END=396 /DNA_ORIENTATION=-